MKLLLVLIGLVAIVSSHVYFHDDFSDANWESRWVVADWKQDSGEAGEWELSAGRYYTDETAERGLRTKNDARFYDISAKHEQFSNKDKTLVIQFSVKHEQNIDCGGGYVKLVGSALSDQKEFRGGDKETPYNVMFGPDICGSSTRKVHFILSKNGKNHLIKKNIAAETDEYTHIYTAVLNADNTYQVYVDGEEKASGSVEEDWDILPPKKIRDPSVSKPGDWVDEKHIDDPEDQKPEGWDDIPSEIADPDAKKPEDWDDELDGEWESPRVSNPEYKGVWSARKIENPAYKGEWVHPEIDNPDYSADASLYAFESFNYLGIDIWQVKSGSVFDNFLLADDLEDAKAAWKVVETRREGEKSVKDERDKEERERNAAENDKHGGDTVDDTEFKDVHVPVPGTEEEETNTENDEEEKSEL